MTPCRPGAHQQNPRECGRFEKCHNKVCGNCNFIIDGVWYCEQCQIDIHEEAYQKSGICPNDGSECEPIYDNVGFTAPDPEKWEIVGWKPCPECGYENND